MFRVNICVTRRKISYSDSNQHVGPSEDCLTSCLRLSTPSWLVPTEDINLYKHVAHLYFKVHQNAAHCSFFHTNRRKWFICAGLLSAAEESGFGALVCVCVCVHWSEVWTESKCRWLKLDQPVGVKLICAAHRAADPLMELLVINHIIWRRVSQFARLRVFLIGRSGCFSLKRSEEGGCGKTTTVKIPTCISVTVREHYITKTSFI